MNTYDFDSSVAPRELSAVTLNLEMGFRLGELSNAMQAVGVNDPALSRLFALCKEAGNRALDLERSVPTVPACDPHRGDWAPR